MIISFRKLGLLLCVECTGGITLGLCVYVLNYFGEHPENALINGIETTMILSALMCTVMIVIFLCTITVDISKGNLK